MIVPADLLDRLQHVERRLLELAERLEPLVDIRAAAADAAPTLDSMLARLQAFTNDMREREQAAEWDAVDQLTARLMLQTLADVAVELRRALNQGAPLLEAARTEAHAARRAFEAVERDLTRRNADDPE
jgi:hypothetical protein